MRAVETYTEAALVLAVSGAAMIYPPLALLVGALWLLGLAIVADRRAESAEVPK